MVKRFVIVCVLALGSPASAIEVTVDVTNLSGSGGVALSPFFIAVHDGSFDAFGPGMDASAGIEAIAELGSSTAIGAEFAAAYSEGVSGDVAATTGGFGPGIFLPGGTGSITLDLDPTKHRYLTYGAMVVPSNDYFTANDMPTAVQLFDAMGNFTGTDVIVTGAQIWNAGTEVDSATNGPAFVDGQDATMGMDEGGTISLNADFSTFMGVSTPAGYVFDSLPTADSEVARISFSVVPEPAGAQLVLAGILASGFLLRSWRVTRRSSARKERS